MNHKKLRPDVQALRTGGKCLLVGLFLLLAGCTGSCAPGTQPLVSQTPPPTVLPSPTPGSSHSPAPQPTPAPVATPQASPSPTPEPAPASKEPVLVDPVPMPDLTPPPVEDTPIPAPEEGPGDEAVLAAYHRAVEAFGWFQMTHLPLDMEAAVAVGDLTYYRVDNPGLETLADLRGYLKSLFSDALVDGLLPADSIQYLEVDGVLYGLDGGRGGDITKGAETLQVLPDGGESRRTVRVTVEILDPEQDFAVIGSETHDFPYEKIGDQWIFTNFYLIR